MSDDGRDHLLWQQGLRYCHVPISGNREAQRIVRTTDDHSDCDSVITQITTRTYYADIHRSTLLAATCLPMPANRQQACYSFSLIARYTTTIEVTPSITFTLYLHCSTGAAFALCEPILEVVQGHSIVSHPQPHRTVSCRLDHSR